MIKRVPAFVLALAMLLGCTCVFAGAQGVFPKDEIKLYMFEDTDFFRKAIAAYGSPLRFESDGGLTVNGAGEVDYLDRRAYEAAEEYGWDGFMPFSLPRFGTSRITAYDGSEQVGAVTVSVKPRWYLWFTFGLPGTLFLLAFRWVPWDFFF